MWLQYGVYGITCWGGTGNKFRNINALGIYDSQTPGRVETVAAIYLPYSVTHAFSTEHTIEGCYLGGGNATPTKTITVGSVTFSSHEDAGCLHAIAVEACEGLKIRNNYLGGVNGNCVHFEAKSICAEIDIEGNFIDGSTGEAFSFQSGNGTNVCFDVSIRNNRANGQQLSREFLRSYNNASGSAASLYELKLIGNEIKNYLKTPVFLNGCRGATISDNRLIAYHNRGGGSGDPNFAAGINVGAASALVECRDNFFGGTTNDAAGIGNCQWGIYSTGGVSFADGNTGNLIGGGSLVSGLSQQYAPGQGTWTTPVVMAGSNYLWVNASSGKLYKKLGTTPVNDTDGTIVGTES